MKLISAPEDPGSLYERLLSEDGKIEMGIYPVMYGFRVRAGFAKSQCYELDWCGGDDLKQIHLLYAICRTILEKREFSLDLFYDLPSVSAIKPFWKDEKFTKIITDAAGEISPLPSFTMTDLHQAKSKSIKYAMSI